MNSSSKPAVFFKRADAVAGIEEIVTSEHYEGAKSLRMQHNDAYWQAAYQDMSVGSIIPGNTYIFSSRFKIVPSHMALIKLFDIDWKNASGRAVGKDFLVLTSSNGTWNQISRTIAIPLTDDFNETLNNHGWRVYIYGHYPAIDRNDICYDNVMLTRQSDTANLIVNPCFESDFFGWSHSNIIAMDELARTVSLNDTEWHTLGVSYEKPALKLYLDGVKIAERAVNLKEFPENCIYFAGSRAHNVNSFDGYIDDLFVTDRALGDLQALQYHQTQHKTLTLPAANNVNCIINKNGQKLSAKLTHGAPPRAPSRLTVRNVSPTTAVLSWMDNSSDEDSFYIKRSQSPDGQFGSIAGFGRNTTSFTDGALTANATYYYMVTAANEGGESGPSNIVLIKTAEE